MNKTEQLTNFEFLKEIDPLFFQLAKNAELTFVSDPNTSLIKVRQLGEAIVQYTVDAYNLTKPERPTQIDLINLFENDAGISRNITTLFHTVRKLGNTANHEFKTSHRDALNGLCAAHSIAIWFYETFNQANKKVTHRAFKAPTDPSEKYRTILLEKERLERELERSINDAELRAQFASSNEEAEKELLLLQQQMGEQEAENRELIKILEDEREELEASYQKKLQGLHAVLKKSDHRALARSQRFVVDDSLSEQVTRIIIDGQLKDAGWVVDTQTITHSKGSRPEIGRNIAIAEWPLNKGYQADYVLFAGLTPIAVVEAKKQNIDVAGKIDQAERYSINFKMANEFTSAWSVEGLDAPWQNNDLTYFIPFVYSSNGRPYAKQLLEKSGTWYRDIRQPSNIKQALQSFHSPEGLLDFLKRDKELAKQKLKNEPFDYLQLRYYQEDAIRATEKALDNGQKEILLAMATGTGKTRTIIGLTYRLLKAERFKRVLFLVDRSALGKQTSDSMQDYILEQNQEFSNIYNVAGLKTRFAEENTRVQIATVQAMVKRLFVDQDNSIPIDEYDCIIVDEAHRGYTLDQEMTEQEILFRDERQYQSTYRRVLDYFDAVRIALTATPAKHTVDIFGHPVYEYAYQTAIIDGYLIDHDPPKRYETLLNTKGVHFEKGEAVSVVERVTGELNIVELEDELDFEVESFNRRVITPDFNRVICEDLADELDPIWGDEKTLIFCVTDNHADEVKNLLDKAFFERYGTDYNEKAVAKITGQSDKVEQLIRNYKNEKYPNIAITVDLLSTGIDVPQICNIVFMRKVRSRILYEQMKGRATRRCDEIGKTIFKIFDPVDLYATLEKVSTMKPIVKDPNITLEFLHHELITADVNFNEATDSVELSHQKHLEDVLAQFNQKVMRVLRSADKKAEKNPALKEKLAVLEESWGVSPKDLDQHLHHLGVKGAQEFLMKHKSLLNDINNIQSIIGSYQNPVISNHKDEIINTEYNYGELGKPEDYIKSFKDFIVNNQNLNVALSIVINRPADLTRTNLKEIKTILDEHGYRESYLRSAWRTQTNEEITASIIGFIRQAALGEPLIPFEDRVRKAMREVMKMYSWTTPQKKWLERIEKQLITEIILDRDRISEIFAMDGGDKRLDMHLNQRLDDVLDNILSHLWVA